jgi:hypothetical protein
MWPKRHLRGGGYESGSNAGKCRKLFGPGGKKANQPARLRYIRMASAWRALADNQDWLDGALASSPTPIIPGSGSIMPPNRV